MEYIQGIRQEHLLKTALTCKLPADVWKKVACLQEKQSHNMLVQLSVLHWGARVYQRLWSDEEQITPNFLELSEI